MTFTVNAHLQLPDAASSLNVLHDWVRITCCLLCQAAWAAREKELQEESAALSKKLRLQSDLSHKADQAAQAKVIKPPASWPMSVKGLTT